MLFALFVALVSASTFSMRLHGNCEDEANQYTCFVSGESQQALTLLGDDGIFFDHHKLDLGVNATMTFKGHNPLPNSFNEQGVFSLGASAFSFTGSGNFYRNAQNVIFGAGGYNVTGLSGSWQNKSGVMTALNHGAEADNSFTVHLWVVFE